MKRVARHPLSLLAALALAAATLAGCGDDDGSGNSSGSADSAATEAVCTARTDLTDALNTVVDDAKAGNFGDARQHGTDVRTSADQLKTAVGDLGQDERDKLQPQVDQLTADLQKVTDATSLAELQATLVTVRTELGELVDTLKSDLGCSD